MPLFYLFFTILLLQADVPLKASREFEVNTNYELRKKPEPEHPRIVFDKPEEKQKSSGTDLLPYLSVKVKVKRWPEDVTHIKIVDTKDKTHLKKKASDKGIYELDLGFVDDMKDKVTASKFFIQFLKDKKTIEQITIEIEEDGSFLVNGEKRGKF
jgi:hypothetical protein